MSASEEFLVERSLSDRSRFEEQYMKSDFVKPLPDDIHGIGMGFVVTPHPFHSV
jgi:hypothetical protein